MNTLGREDPGLRKEMMVCMKRSAAKCTPSTDKVSLPSYYRNLWDFKSSDGMHEFRYSMGCLMDNRPILARHAKAGKGAFENYFLCGTLDLDELPWDYDDHDW